MTVLSRPMFNRGGMVHDERTIRNVDDEIYRIAPKTHGGGRERPCSTPDAPPLGHAVFYPAGVCSGGERGAIGERHDGAAPHAMHGHARERTRRQREGTCGCQWVLTVVVAGSFIEYCQKPRLNDGTGAQPAWQDQNRAACG